jgi:hypothetical protein
MESYAYIATVSKALSAHRHGLDWVGVVLRGRAGRPFPPNIIHKRLSRKAYATKAEARAAAVTWMERRNLPTWTRTPRHTTGGDNEPA